MSDDAKKKKQSHLWARDPDDFYIENHWCNDALFAREKFTGMICDPCCGTGRVLDAARRAGYLTLGYDIRDRGVERHKFTVRDFFETGGGTFDNIVCNPPYKYDEEFLRVALKRAIYKVAVLLRAQWANAGTRSAWLESLPLRRVLALTPRPSMPPGAVVQAIEHGGALDENGLPLKIGGGLQDYSWFIFEHGYTGEPAFGWARRARKHKG